MADITDVYVRIKYKKNGKIYEDDLLEDEEVNDFEDKMYEIMGEYSLEEFEKFLDEVKLK